MIYRSTTYLILLLSTLFGYLQGLPIETPSTPYIIYRKNGGAGFWSNFMVVLASIDIADKKGWTPVIDMERYQTLYKEAKPVNNCSNAWEYFFEQPGGLSLKEALKLHAPNNQGGKDGVFSRARSIIPPENKIVRARELIEKYIHIKPEVLESVTAIIPLGLTDTILGVHVRGTDRRKGAPGHLMTSSANVYLKKAIELDQTYHFSQVFLACDEIETVKMFQKTFKERLLFSDAYRVSANSANTVHIIKDESIPPRPLHKYLLGREVLIDALLLARCGHLLCGPSNVSHAAIYFASKDPIIHEVESPGFFKK